MSVSELPLSLHGVHFGACTARIDRYEPRLQSGSMTGMWKPDRATRRPLLAGSGGSQRNCPRSIGYDSDCPVFAGHEQQLLGVRM